jgi:hypothetical protein
MKRFTDSIRKSVECKNWYGALSMALMLPDICGRLEKPCMGSQARYIAWFQQWLELKYTGFLGPGREKHVFLCGEDCYALRCSYLHEGGNNIEEQRVRKALDDFHFIIPKSSHTVHMNQFNNSLQLQVDIFCIDVADAVDSWDSQVAKNSRDIEDRMRELLVIHNSD